MGLLEKKPSKRLGSLRGFEEVKEHEFCKGINWEDVRKKKFRPPIEVNIWQSNFDAEYTRLPINLNIEKEVQPDQEKVVKLKRARSHLIFRTRATKKHEDYIPSRRQTH